MSVLVFDIETVADTAAYRLLHNLVQDMPEEEVLAAMESARLQEVANTFQRHHLHRVVCISLLLADLQQCKIMFWTLGREHSEPEILQRFFAGIDKFIPTLVSWNGTGFDLPVLHYRALMHGVRANAYFANGEDTQSESNIKGVRFNNYFSRYHWRHLDLMDILSAYQAKAAVSLNDMAKLCGFPGKLATDGSKVQDLLNAGNIAAVCDYCETDVLNTFGVYLRFELMRGNIDHSVYQANLDALERKLVNVTADGKNAHLAEFLEAWRQQRQTLADLRNAQNAQTMTQSQSNHLANKESKPQENKQSENTQGE